MEFTRRDLGRMGRGAGLASMALPIRAQEDVPKKKVGYCIVGLGRISMDHFMPAMKNSQKAQITAVVSGHRDKAEKIAAEYNIPTKNIYDYKNYDDIAHNSDIDAMYIALPNNMHAEYTIRAANAGKARAFREADGDQRERLPIHDRGVQGGE